MLECASIVVGLQTFFMQRERQVSLWLVSHVTTSGSMLLVMRRLATQQTAVPELSALE